MFEHIRRKGLDEFPEIIRQAVGESERSQGRPAIIRTARMPAAGPPTPPGTRTRAVERC
ncbi:MAG: hypothetical protein KKB20_23020 [Proteobacteria bacterium]|nr:hypothetical protein [Pseudomonadota bacterium]